MRTELVVVRGGGDLATGVVWRLWRSGLPVVVCELAQPLTVRRTVAVSSAVGGGTVEVEGMPARLVDTADEAERLARAGVVAVLVSPDLPPLQPAVVVDARLAKRNLGTSLADAPLVIGLGPGFTAGVDVHAVIETQRGPRLGRAIRDGAADAMMGLQISDEASDHGPDRARDVTPRRGGVIYRDDDPALPPPAADDFIEAIPTPAEVEAKMAEVAREFAEGGAE